MTHLKFMTTVFASLSGSELAYVVVDQLSIEKLGDFLEALATRVEDDAEHNRTGEEAETRMLSSARLFEAAAILQGAEENSKEGCICGEERCETCRREDTPWQR